jgi:hypothetical protein
MEVNGGYGKEGFPHVDKGLPVPIGFVQDALQDRSILLQFQDRHPAFELESDMSPVFYFLHDKCHLFDLLIKG